jgi:iron complex outermembrane receptor protein
LGARLDVPLSSGSERRFIAALDWVYQSRIFYNETNSLAGSAPGYGLLSGRLEVKNVVRGLDLALWSRNLLDKQYYYSGSDSFSSALGILYEAPGEPRTFGIEARFAF